MMLMPMQAEPKATTNHASHELRIHVIGLIRRSVQAMMPHGYAKIVRS